MPRSVTHPRLRGRCSFRPRWILSLHFLGHVLSLNPKTYLPSDPLISKEVFVGNLRLTKFSSLKRGGRILVRPLLSLSR